MDQNWIDSFKSKLDQHHRWPSAYMFKFIVPKGKVDELKSLFPDQNTSEKLSSDGNYVSVTIQMIMHSSEAVIEVYKTASKIEGLVAL